MHISFNVYCIKWVENAGKTTMQAVIGKALQCSRRAANELVRRLDDPCKNAVHPMQTPRRTRTSWHRKHSPERDRRGKDSQARSNRSSHQEVPVVTIVFCTYISRQDTWLEKRRRHRDNSINRVNRKKLWCCKRVGWS